MNTNTDSRDRKPVVNIPRVLDAMDLEHALEVATLEARCARRDVAAREAAFEDALSTRIAHAMRANLETARYHLARAEETLQALERERDATTWSRRRPEVIRLIAERLAQLGRIPSALLDNLGNEARELAQKVETGRASARDEDQLELARAALFVAVERWDVVSRIMMGVAA